jgi:uncharacterized protein GlcG (DUF336 family)
MRNLLAASLLCLALPAAAQDATFEVKLMTPETAQRLAQAALEHCRAQGYQVGVTVVDRSGVPQVFLRDRFAGAHTPGTSYRKAWTAVSFRSNTTDLSDVTQPGEISYGIRQLDEALALGGGLMVESAGALVGGVGVSGAPSPALDDECAEAGIDAVADDLAF